ncbi:hypothetical protein L218DRAFT_997076 [Marasmius fiardii PR-910]|nr:hypothetical protein L218DRAFT_997076 [Marasmius fiardii PR-910]
MALIPDLPIEIVQGSFEHLWLSPLSSHDRKTLIRTSLLVSKRWTSLFNEIGSKDVYLVSPSHARRFLSVLQGYTGGHWIPDYSSLCRSIIFQHGHEVVLPSPSTYTELHMMYAVNELLHHLCSNSFQCPRLRKVAFQLENYLPESFFVPQTLRFFPCQVTELEIDFHYAADTPPEVLNAIRLLPSARRHSSPRPGSLPNISRLRVMGSSQDGVMVMTEACPNVKWSEVEQDTVRSDYLLETPHSLLYFVCESID